MKKQLLFLAALFAASFLQISAQCMRSGTFNSMGNPDTSRYPISGNANITIGSDGKLTVNFEDSFISAQGFVLNVFLSKTQSINTNVPNPSQYIRVDRDGDLICDPHSAFGPGHDEEPMTGAITFSEDLTGITLNEYQFIILQCTQFNVPWGFVDLGAQSTGCALSINDNKLSNVGIFPNPSKGKVTLKAQTNENAKISVYNILGKIVYDKTQSLNSEMNLSNLKTGIYMVKITSEGKHTTKRLIIE